MLYALWTIAGLLAAILLTLFCTLRNYLPALEILRQQILCVDLTITRQTVALFDEQAKQSDKLIRAIEHSAPDDDLRKIAHILTDIYNYEFGEKPWLRPTRDSIYNALDEIKQAVDSFAIQEAEARLPRVPTDPRDIRWP
jgi:hypothetical protein